MRSNWEINSSRIREKNVSANRWLQQGETVDGTVWQNHSHSLMFRWRRVGVWSCSGIKKKKNIVGMHHGSHPAVEGMCGRKQPAVWRNGETAQIPKESKENVFKISWLLLKRFWWQWTWNISGANSFSREKEGNEGRNGNVPITRGWESQG